MSAETRLASEQELAVRCARRGRTISTCSSISVSDKEEDDEEDEEMVDEGVQSGCPSPIPLSDNEQEGVPPSQVVTPARRTSLTKAAGDKTPEQPPSKPLDQATALAALREANSTCAFEAMVCLTRLFAEGNRQKRAASTATVSEEVLTPVASVTAAMETIFQSLAVFKESASMQRQTMLCLIEMASLFPVSFKFLLWKLDPQSRQLFR